MDGLRDALRAEAARHSPDREAILARVAAGQAPERRSRAQRRALRRTPLRLAGLAATCAVLLGASVAGTWAAVGHYLDPRPQTVTTTTASTGPVPPAPTPSGSRGAVQPGPTAAVPPTGAPASASSSATASAPSASAPAGQSPGPTRVQQGFLWSDGSVDPGSNSSWAQSDVTVKSRYTVTALEVTLRVALTPGVATTGEWSTVPAQDLTVSVTRQGGFLLYRWTLKPGVTLAAGTYEFAGQYDHAAGGRDAGRDSYAATATGHGEPVSVYGDFYPVSGR
jgi:hypothetical protein